MSSHPYLYYVMQANRFDTSYHHVKKFWVFLLWLNVSCDNKCSSWSGLLSTTENLGHMLLFNSNDKWLCSVFITLHSFPVRKKVIYHLWQVEDQGKAIISQALCMTYNEDVLHGRLFKEWNILQVFQLLASLVGLLWWRQLHSSDTLCNDDTCAHN